jgi:hypothetical protein
MFPEPKLPNALLAVGMSLLAYGLIPQSSSFPHVHLGGVSSRLPNLIRSKQTRLAETGDSFVQTALVIPPST